MDKKKLIKSLTEKLQNAKLYALSNTEKVKETNELCIVEKCRYMLNPKYISAEQNFQIIEFYNFLMENPSLTNEEVNELLNSKLEFSFLKKLNKEIPNMLEELKRHGPKYIAIEYASQKKKEELKRLYSLEQKPLP